MAERGGLDPEEPPGPSPARQRPDRDPVALAAWRRVAEQRNRRGRDDDAAEPVTHRHAEPDTPSWGLEPPASPAPVGAARAEPSPPTLGSGPPPTRGGSGPPPTLHDVLLGLAGRIDDDALASVRELVALEEDAGAAELLGGCLLAAEVGLTDAERAVLALWFGATRVDAELLGRLPSDPEATARATHRFVDAVGSAAGDDVDVLAQAASRLPGVTGLRRCWRVTPAGTAPGPVPHCVVLVETASAEDCEPVAHHMAHAAREVGAASVEVFPAGAALPAYHAAAVAVAVAVAVAGPVAGTTAGATTAERFASVDGPNWRAVDPHGAPGEDDGERWRTVASAGPDVAEPSAEPSAAPPAEAPVVAPVVGGDAGPALPTLDYGSTADRIAALWSTPAPVDVLPAPLDAGALGTSVEPDDRSGVETADLRGLPERGRRDDVAEPAIEIGPAPRTAAPAVADGEDDDGDAATELTAVAGPRGPDTAGPAGRDAATALTPTASTSAGQEPTALTPTVPASTPSTSTGQEPTALTPTASTPATQEPGDPSATQVVDVGASGQPGTSRADDGRVRRVRSSRASTDEDEEAPAFGHDARYGAAGTGPAWPGGASGGVPSGGSPHDGLLVPSPVEIGQEPIDLGGRTNGHHVGATNGAHHDEEPAGPDVAGRGAPDPTTDPVGWSPETPSTSSDAWSSDTEEAVAQLSDRERALLARLHEELASRERAEGWETPAAEEPPADRPAPPGEDRQPGPPTMRPFAVPPFPANGSRPPRTGADPDAATSETPWPPPRRTGPPSSSGRNGHGLNGLNGHTPHRDDEGDDDTDGGRRG